MSSGRSSKLEFSFLSDALEVYNCASGTEFSITIKQLLDIGITGICHEFAMEKNVWVANGGVTLNKPYNMLRIVFFQLSLAVLIDFGLKVKKQKPRWVKKLFKTFQIDFNIWLFRLMQIQRRMYEANKALSYFVTNNWDFKNEKFLNLNHFLKAEDVRGFSYSHTLHWDIIYYVSKNFTSIEHCLLRKGLF